MSWKDTAEPVLTRFPGVAQPDGHVSFKRKLGATAGVLLLYFILTNIHLFGLKVGSAGGFGRFRTLLAGGRGTILHLGIGPIVTASIVLQLLSGAELLGLNTQEDPRDQAIYQGLQKWLVLAMVLFTGIPMVFSGMLPPSPKIASAVGVPLIALQFGILAQLIVGGLVILYFDEIISKWGVGSGIGLFIIAGVSQRLIGGLIGVKAITGVDGVLTRWVKFATGMLEFGPVISMAGVQRLLVGPGSLVPVFTTLLIFAVVVYAESVRVEIPLSHSRAKGARGRFPIKLIYASVLPMILVRAVQANIQLVGRLLAAQNALPAWLGVYNQGRAVSGMFYYLSPIYSPQDWMWWTGATGHEPWQILLRIGIDLTFMVGGGAIFAVFWVETTDMGPESVAKQIQHSGMQIPGFRQSSGVLKTVVGRYIPQVTVLGGALVGLLAVAANMLGTIGSVSGTGLLLTVSITYKLYEEIAEEQLKEMAPMMEDILG